MPKKPFLYCEETDTKIYANDVVTISTHPETKWIVKNGWYSVAGIQKNGWYFVSIEDRSIISIDQIDIKNITNESRIGSSSETRPESDSSVNTIPEPDYIEITDTRLCPNDLITISGSPDIWVVKKGWYKIGTAQKNGWYVINISNRAILPIEDIDLSTVTKEVEQGTTELRPTLQDIDTVPAESKFIVIPGTDIRLYDSDIVKISDHPTDKWIVHIGWYIYDDVQNYGWYFVSIKNGEILPVSVIDLTLCTLVTLKTQGSELYDGKVVNYTRPFTLADAEVLKRTFITVDTIEQRNNLDPKKMVNGKLVRVNDVGGVPGYYAWNEETQTWDKVDWGGSGSGGIPELEGTPAHPIILSKIEEGLYRVIGVYKITPDTEPITTDINHLAFVSGVDPTTIKVITESNIQDYIVVGNQITFSNKYATELYVDNQIALIEQQISEIISELPSIIDARIADRLEPIPDSFIRSLFGLYGG